MIVSESCTYEEFIKENSFSAREMIVYDKDGNRWPRDIPIPTDAEVLQTLRDPMAMACDIFINARPNETEPNHERYLWGDNSMTVKKYDIDYEAGYMEFPDSIVGKQLVCVSRIIAMQPYGNKCAVTLLDGQHVTIDMPYEDVKALIFVEVSNDEPERN